MIASRAVMASIAAGMLIGLVACAPVPEAEPSPTPTSVFASEEEAFAAAEEVYRAYNEAYNHIDLQDMASMEPLAELTTAEHFAQERKAVSEFHAEGIVQGGEAVIEWFEADSYDPGKQVVARVCIDNSQTTFVDAEGESIVPEDRPTHYALSLIFELQGVRLKVAEATPIDEATCPPSP